MATEFTVFLAAQYETDEVLAFVADELSGGERDERVVRRHDLWVRAWPMDDEDVADWSEIVRREVRTQLRMRLVGGVAPEVWEAAFVTGTRLGIQCLERFGDGLLTYLVEEIVAVRTEGTTTLNSLWHGWHETPALTDVFANFPAAEFREPKL